MARKKRFRGTDSLLRQCRAHFDKTVVAIRACPELNSLPRFKNEFLRIRTALEATEESVRLYSRAENTYARLGSTEVTSEAVDRLLEDCDNDVSQLHEDVTGLHAEFLDAVSGFSDRLTSLHTKLKRLRAGYLSTAKRLATEAHVALRVRAPQVGALPNVQDALQRVNDVVV
jgi:GTP1/Obg family GTP-binding protein